ncbi:hypothetical protein D3C78_1862650 [compost metagenome]
MRLSALPVVTPPAKLMPMAPALCAPSPSRPWAKEKSATLRMVSGRRPLVAKATASWAE